MAEESPISSPCFQLLAIEFHDTSICSGIKPTLPMQLRTLTVSLQSNSGALPSGIIEGSRGEIDSTGITFASVALSRL